MNTERKKEKQPLFSSWEKMEKKAERWGARWVRAEK